LESSIFIGRVKPRDQTGRLRRRGCRTARRTACRAGWRV